jgi:hypothetical protein
LYLEKYIVVGSEDSLFIDPNGNDNFRVLAMKNRFQEVNGHTFYSPSSEFESMILNSGNESRARSSAIINNDQSGNSEDSVGSGIIDFSRRFMRVSPNFKNSSFVNAHFLFEGSVPETLRAKVTTQHI